MRALEHGQEHGKTLLFLPCTAEPAWAFEGAAALLSQVWNVFQMIYHLYKLPQVTIRNQKVLLRDGQVFEIDGIRIECLLVPGHTWGHMVYLIDDQYLFLGAFRKMKFVDCGKPFFKRLMYRAFLDAK